MPIALLRSLPIVFVIACSADVTGLVGQQNRETGPGNITALLSQDMARKSAPRSLTITGPTSCSVPDTITVNAVAKDTQGRTVSSPQLSWTSSFVTVAAIVSVASDHRSAKVRCMSQGSAAVMVVWKVQNPPLSATHSFTVNGGSQPPPVGIAITVGMNADSAVQANPAGTTFVFASGTHRRQSIRPKVGDTFLAQSGAILDGENATQFLFRGYNGSTWIDDVTIRNITYTRYNPPAQNGAIWGGDDRENATDRWVLDSVYGHHNTNLALRIGNHMRVQRSRFFYNTTINFGGIGVGVLFDGVESAFGNSGCLNDPGFESGGSKFVWTDSLIVRNSYFHDNCGVGLWLDIDNINYLLENNTITNNVREGIAVEISYRGVVRNNTLDGNGIPQDSFRQNGWCWDAAIGIHATSDAEVYGNVIGANSINYHGIVLLQQNRGTGRYGPYLVQNAWIHDNTIYERTTPDPGNGNGASLGCDDTGSTALFTSRNNRFDRNIYYLGNNPRPFGWMNNWRTTAEWRGYGLDANGTFNP